RPAKDDRLRGIGGGVNQRQTNARHKRRTEQNRFHREFLKGSRRIVKEPLQYEPRPEARASTTHHIITAFAETSFPCRWESSERHSALRVVCHKHLDSRRAGMTARHHPLPPVIRLSAPAKFAVQRGVVAAPW